MQRGAWRWPENVKQQDIAQQFCGLGGRPDGRQQVGKSSFLGEDDGDVALHGREVTQLSIGQQQRVAAARALLGRPGIIVADEPTSSLDHDSRESFLGLLMQECRQQEATLLFVSHDTSLGPLFDRVVSLAELNRAPARAA